jgi:hypothetical protein
MELATPFPQIKFRTVAIFLLLILLSPAILRAEGDFIKLKNGKILQGHIAAWNSTRSEIYFASDDDDEAEPQWMSVSDIESIHYSGLAPTSTIKKKTPGPVTVPTLKKNTPVPKKAAA